MSLSPNLLRATLAQLKRDGSRAERGGVGKRCFGIQAEGWAGPDTIVIDGETLQVVMCESPLAVREAMDRADEGTARIVVITPCSSAELGIDVEARVVRNKFQRPDPWQAVRDRFRADGGLAPNVPRENWLRDELLRIPESDLPKLSTSTFLAFDTVRAAVFASFGLPHQPDLRSLIAWASRTSTAVWEERSQEVRNAVTTWLVDLLGESAGVVLACVAVGHGENVRSLGLVLRLLLEEKNVPVDQREVLVRASGKAEAFLARKSMHARELAPWVEQVESELMQAVSAGGAGDWQQVQANATQLMQHLGLDPLAGHSRCLLAGLRARESMLARELAHVRTSGANDLAPVARAIESVQSHLLAESERKGRLRALPMSLRLLRYLRSAAEETQHFGACVQRYVDHESFVDWAREVLDYPDPVQTELVELWRAVAARREQFNRRFAEAAATQFAVGASVDGVVPLERAIEEVVAPLAASTGVVVLVLDGCSLGVFREIYADFEPMGWIEVGPVTDGGRGQRRTGLALLPSVTEVSRASLLCGEVTTGSAADEKSGFAAHPALRHGRSKPVLFHKDAMTDERVGMTEAAVKALSKDGPRVVGFVLNAIDDWLAKSDTDAAAWSIERIKPLMEILEQAAIANRVVIVTSDHGHVREHNSTYVEGKDGTRFRLPGNPSNQEFAIRGDRVVVAGKLVLAPHCEQLRYTAAKQNGYHGGATPQELLVPLSIFVHRSHSVEGLAETPFVLPPWWQDGAVVPAPAARPATSNKTSKAPDAAPQRTQALPFANQGRALVAKLFGSEIYKAQKKLAERARIDDSKFEAMLGLLIDQGGTMTLQALAVRLQVPESRARGYLVGMRRVLNMDGVEVLVFDEVSGTLKLDTRMLRMQFAIEEE